MAIDRPDWGPGGESRAVVPVAEPAVPAERESSRELSADYLPGGPLAGMSEGQVEMAGPAAEQVLSTLPNSSEFASAFDTLSPALQGKVFRTLASHPHLRRFDLLDAIEKKLTLSEQVEAEQWLSGLPPQHARALMGTVKC